MVHIILYWKNHSDYDCLKILKKEWVKTKQVCLNSKKMYGKMIKSKYDKMKIGI